MPDRQAKGKGPAQWPAREDVACGRSDASGRKAADRRLRRATGDQRPAPAGAGTEAAKRPRKRAISRASGGVAGIDFHIVRYAGQPRFQRLFDLHGDIADLDEVDRPRPHIGILRGVTPAFQHRRQRGKAARIRLGDAGKDVGILQPPSAHREFQFRVEGVRPQETGDDVQHRLGFRLGIVAGGRDKGGGGAGLPHVGKRGQEFGTVLEEPVETGARQAQRVGQRRDLHRIHPFADQRGIGGLQPPLARPAPARLCLFRPGHGSTLGGSDGRGKLACSGVNVNLT